MSTFSEWYFLVISVLQASHNLLSTGDIIVNGSHRQVAETLSGVTGAVICQLSLNWWTRYEDCGSTEFSDLQTNSKSIAVCAYSAADVL